MEGMQRELALMEKRVQVSPQTLGLQHKEF